jgi:NAD+ kinase
VTRSILLVAHTGRPSNVAAARRVVQRLQAAGIEVRVLKDEAPDLELADCAVAEHDAADGCELVLVLGGDGTILRAADLARHSGVPLLGVNLGHVGFLAAAESDDLDSTVEQVLERRYEVEERLTLEVAVFCEGDQVVADWALNEASIEKANRQRMVELVLEVDGRPLSQWGCDGLVVATPTGSTAYAFSVGGPVVWPTVEALLVAPISAHALFARPLVVGPGSLVAVDLFRDGSDAVLSCDGRRTHALPPGSRIEVRRGAVPVRLARTRETTFTDTLVDKFALPVQGWPGRSR